MTLRLRVLVGLIFVVFSLGACTTASEESGGAGGAGGTGWGGLGDTTFEVTWSPDTTVVEGADLDLLKAVDVDAGRYTFDASGAAASGLDLSTGRILVVEGKGLGRIVQSDAVGDSLVVDTEDAPLTDAITDGTIAWDYGVDFSADHVQTVSVAGFPATHTQVFKSPIKLTYSASGYDYTIQIDLEGTKATFTFTVEKTLAGNVKGRFVAQGTIERFRNKDSIVIAGSKLKSFDHTLEKMKGDLTLELDAVAESGSMKDPNIEFKVPVPVLTIPFQVGLLPVQLSIKIQFVLSAVIPPAGSAWVKTRFSYDSDLGLSYDGTQVASSARAGDPKLEKQEAQVAAPTQIGANFGIGFPRVELDILRSSVVPWAQTAFLVGGSFTENNSAGVPVCVKADALFLGAAGYDLSLFGVIKLASGDKTLFKQTKPLLRSGDCPPD